MEQYREQKKHGKTINFNVCFFLFANMLFVKATYELYDF